MSEEKQQNQETPGGEFKKQETKFNSNLTKLTALMQGKVRPDKKLSSGDTQEVVTELLEERQKELKASLKTSLKELIEKKIKLDGEFKAKEEEIIKLKTEKYKEFNKAASDLLNKIDGFDAIETSYNNILSDIAKGGDNNEIEAANK